MKLKLSLLILTCFLCGNMAFANSYYNLMKIATGADSTLVLSQSELSCALNTIKPVYSGYGYYPSYNTVGAWSTTLKGITYYSQYVAQTASMPEHYNIVAMTSGFYGTNFTQKGVCLASVIASQQNLHFILTNNLKNRPSGIRLEIASDINLNEIGANGKCSVNHTPIPTHSNMRIVGNGFTIKNLCYDSTTTAPFGLFDTIDSSMVDSLKIDNVQISINSSNSNGANYYPVGALSGYVNYSTINNVTISNVTINAPFAGGVIGFAKNSTIKNIRGHDDIFISNNVAITSGYAGSKLMSKVSNYNAFLGGIVGVAYRNKNTDPTFLNDSVKVDVHDSATGHNSAVGGIAGLFSTTGEAVSDLHVYTKYKTSGEIVASKISGGAAMGGLFGARMVYSENNSPVTGDFSITNSSFDGEIENASSTGIIAVGGIIGLDSALAKMYVKIDSSNAKVAIKDSLTVAHKYRYYAGGILGYGSSCIAGTGDDTDFFTLNNLNTSGSIKIATTNVHSQTYLGGIAGAACLAQKANFGLFNDTSSVEINSNVKSSFDNQITNNGSNAFDSLIIGGIIGHATVAYSSKAATLENLHYTGSITINDTLNSAFVGGILGSFTQAGGKSLKFNNIFVNSASDLINFNSVQTSVTSQNKQVAKIGGLCGYCEELETIEFVGITGKIKATGAIDSILVGGFVGSIKSSNKKLTLKNSFVNGDIDATSNKTLAGYLLGNALLQQDFDIKSSYHFGSDALDAFGALKNNIDVTNTWKTNTNINYIIRNSSVKNHSSQHNGTSLAETMHTSKFAGYLNKAYTTSTDYAWSFVQGKNDNLPIFASTTNRPIIPGVETFSVSFIDKDSLIIETQDVTENSAATEPANVTQYEGFKFEGWDKSFDNITSDLTVTAIYKINKYLITFKKGSTILKQNSVTYMSSTTAPTVPDSVGYTFVGWSDSSFNCVKSDLNILAEFSLNKYAIKFMNYDSSLIFEDSIGYNILPSEPIDFTRKASAEYTYSFKGWSPTIAPVTKDTTYTALYDSTKVKYTVKFFAKNLLLNSVEVEYGNAAIAPIAPDSVGYSFSGWSDSSFKNVKRNINDTAIYSINKYLITFKNFDDSVIVSANVDYGKTPVMPINPMRNATEKYIYTFKNWNPTIAPVTKNTTYMALYDSTKVKYTVRFFANNLLLDSVEVEYGDSATAPIAPNNIGYTFVGWDRSFTKITKALDVAAIYEAILQSSSSIESSSSVESSSSLESSSSIEKLDDKLKIVDPIIEQSGNAIKLVFDAKNTSDATVAKVKVVGENGVIIDTTISKHLISGGVWEMTPAPVGKFTVTLTLDDKEQVANFESDFEINSEIEVKPESWQMVSLSALDKSTISNDDDAAFYWWDETNPIGDYWQYKAYAGEAFEPTRGFWYGSTNGAPLIIRKTNSSVESEIVWQLDSIYSGWNLVANPYGWYVDLSNGKADDNSNVELWRWNPATAEYEIPKILAPYEAIWIKAKHATTWRVSAAPTFDIVETTENKTLRKNAALKNKANNWNIVAVLSDDNGKKDSWNVIGAGTQEEFEEPPAGMGDHVSLTIRENNNRLAKSIRDVSDEYNWTFDASATSMRNGKLWFEGTDALQKFGYKLFVTVDGKTSEISNGEKLNLALTKSAKKVNVRIATNAAETVANKINSLRTIVTSEGLNVQFNVPETFAGAKSSYVLVDVNGKKVASSNFTATNGTNSIAVNAKKSGLYFIKVNVASQKLTGKILIK